MSSNRYVVMSMVTTGASPKDGDRIIEMGLLEVIDHEITNMLETLLTPEERAVSLRTTLTHGLTDKDVQNLSSDPIPTFALDAISFMKFIAGEQPLLTKPILITYDKKAAIEFFDAEMKHCQPRWSSLESSCEIIDVLEISKRIYPVNYLQNNINNLLSLAKLVTPEAVHSTERTALSDAYLIQALFSKLLPKMREVEQVTRTNQAAHPAMLFTRSNTIDEVPVINSRLNNFP